MQQRTSLAPRVLVRLLAVPVVAAYLGLLHGPTPVHLTDWLLGLAAAGAVVAGRAAPLAVVTVDSVLVAVGLHGPGAAVAAVMPLLFTLDMLALGELWLWRTGWQRWAGAAVFVAAQLVLYLPHLNPLLTAVSVLLVTAPPVLIGCYLALVRSREAGAEQRSTVAAQRARADERAAIARELHDLVAHHMASVAVQVGAVRHALTGRTDNAVDEALGQAHATARAALADLGTLMTTLRDPAASGAAASTAVVESNGLPAAVCSAIERVRAAGHQVRGEVADAVVALDALHRLAVLRVVQESLTNVIKHAGAGAAVTVRVAVTDAVVQVLVTDDGGHRGATSADRPDTGGSGFGLIGMRERVELLGGTLRSAAAGAGWSVAATIPVGSR